MNTTSPDLWFSKQDMFIIAFSSCTRWVPNKSGYRRLDNGQSNGGGRRGGRNDPEDENRLIDELDEDWGTE